MTATKECAECLKVQFVIFSSTLRVLTSFPSPSKPGSESTVATSERGVLNNSIKLLQPRGSCIYIYLVNEIENEFKSNFGDNVYFLYTDDYF